MYLYTKLFPAERISCPQRGKKLSKGLSTYNIENMKSVEYFLKTTGRKETVIRLIKRSSSAFGEYERLNRASDITLEKQSSCHLLSFLLYVEIILDFICLTRKG